MEKLFTVTAEACGRARSLLSAVVLLVALVVAAGVFPATAAPAGFGASTPGGAGQPVVRVTNLNDSGPGSFREAVSKGNRQIVFDVGGEIVLKGHLYAYGPYVTIDGLSAPAPGITLKNYGLIIRGNRGGHNMIVRGLRIRNATIDGLQVAAGASNILVEYVSVHGSADGNLDITESAHDITIAWSVFAAPIGESKNSLIKYNPSRVTLHHNVFVKGRQRNPQVRVDDAGTPASDTTADIRNNLIWDWSNYGTIAWYGPRVNVVNNFYAAPSGSSSTRRNAIVVCEGECDGGVAASRAWAYVAGNVSGDGLTSHINATGNVATPFPAPPVATEDACTAAHLALGAAGARPLDAVDRQYLDPIKLPACKGGPPVLSAAPTAFSFATTQGGPAPAPQTLAVRELAGLATTWTAQTTAGWVTASSGSGVTPASIGVQVDASTLPAGRHQADVIVATASGASSVRIPVTLDVTAPPPTPPSPGGGDGTVVLTVTSGADDASESAAGTVRRRERAQRIGRAYLQAWRFPNVMVPAGATIVSAKLELYGVAYSGEDITVRYAGEASPNAAPIAEVARNLSSRTMTQAGVTDTPAPWTVAARNGVPDLASVVAEIVATAGWQAGAALMLFAADEGSDAVRMVGTAETAPTGTRGARLTISYIAP